MDWIPEKIGNYSVKFLVWESMDNPFSLFPETILDFEVLPDVESICGDGTVYKNGQCLPICGAGTIFQDGKCVLEPVIIDDIPAEPSDVQNTIEPEITEPEITEPEITEPDEPKFCFLWWCW